MRRAYRILIAQPPGTEAVEISDQLPDGVPLEQADVSFVQDHILAGVTEFEADILILDADSESVNAFEIAKTLTIQRPETSVILMSRNEHPDSLRRAMLAGAEEYLIKPVDADTLYRAICDVAEIQRQKRTARGITPPPQEETFAQVIAVCSGKGGVGKTTLAVNLAVAIAAEQKNVALLGLESGDAAVMLNLAPKVGIIDLLSMQDEVDVQMLESCVERHKTGVSLLTASTRYSGHSLELIKSGYALTVVEMLKMSQDFVIVDLPLLLHPEDLRILDVADQIIVVTSSWDLLVLRNTRTFLDSIPETVRNRVKIVLNRADRRDMIQEQDVCKSLQTQLAAVIANDSKLAPNAINVGVPFVVSHPTSAIAQDVCSLARMLLGEQKAAEAKGEKKKFKLFS